MSSRYWRTAFVSGGGSGIGLRLSELLASRRVRVSVFDLSVGPEARERLDRAGEAAEEEIRAGGREASPSPYSGLIESMGKILDEDLVEPFLRAADSGDLLTKGHVAEPFDPPKHPDFDTLATVWEAAMAGMGLELGYTTRHQVDAERLAHAARSADEAREVARHYLAHLPPGTDPSPRAFARDYATRRAQWQAARSRPPGAQPVESLR